MDAQSIYNIYRCSTIYGLYNMNAAPYTKCTMYENRSIIPQLDFISCLLVNILLTAELNLLQRNCIFSCQIHSGLLQHIAQTPL